MRANNPDTRRQEDDGGYIFNRYMLILNLHSLQSGAVCNAYGLLKFRAGPLCARIELTLPGWLSKNKKLLGVYAATYYLCYVYTNPIYIARDYCYYNHYNYFKCVFWYCR